MNKMLIRQEVEILQRMKHNAVAIILSVIEDGKIDGRCYRDNDGAKCIYGHLWQENAELASIKADEVRKMIFDTSGLTPIEMFIDNVRTGDTHITHPKTLGVLWQICQEYVEKSAA